MIQIDRPMPENCYLCDCNSGEYSPDEYEKRYCRLTGRSFNLKDYKKRPDWCPLKEVKHGKWLPLFNGEYTGGAYWFECSECKTVVSGGLQSANRFCKGCGAKMEDGK